MDLERTYKLVLTEKSPNGDEKSERKSIGAWSFDAEKERYTVSFADTSLVYQLVDERCIRERNGVALLLGVERPCPNRLALRLLVPVRRFFRENELIGAFQIHGFRTVKRRH